MLPGDRLVLEIPIYGVTEDLHYDRIQERVDERVEAALKWGASRKNAEAMAIRIEGMRPWQYNQIVGWIQVLQDGCMLKGYLWWTKAKRIRPERQGHVFVQDGKLFELFLFDEMTSSEIFTELANELAHVDRHEPRIKHRYVDLRSFTLLGPHIDWKRALDC